MLARSQTIIRHLFSFKGRQYCHQWHSNYTVPVAIFSVGAEGRIDRCTTPHEAATYFTYLANSNMCSLMLCLPRKPCPLFNDPRGGAVDAKQGGHFAALACTRPDTRRNQVCSKSDRDFSFSFVPSVRHRRSFPLRTMKQAGKGGRK